MACTQPAAVLFIAFLLDNGVVAPLLLHRAGGATTFFVPTGISFAASPGALALHINEQATEIARCKRARADTKAASSVGCLPGKFVLDAKSPWCMGRCSRRYPGVKPDLEANRARSRGGKHLGVLEAAVLQKGMEVLSNREAEGLEHCWQRVGAQGERVYVRLLNPEWLQERRVARAVERIVTMCLSKIEICDEA